MKIQNTLLESVCKTPKESLLKSALGGNQLVSPPSYKQANIRKWVLGIPTLHTGAWVNPGFDSYATPWALQQSIFKLYTTRTDVVFDPNGDLGQTTMTASAFVSSGVPVNSGYTFTPPPNPWCVAPGIYGESPTAYLPGTGYNAFGISFDPSSYYDFPQYTETHFYRQSVPFESGYDIHCATTTLSGEIDWAAAFSQAKSAILAETFDWSVAAFQKKYDEPSEITLGQDISSLGPFTFNLTSLAAGTPPPPYWGIGTYAAAANGWVARMSFSSASGGFAIAVGLGLAKNTTGQKQGYFIARMRRAPATGVAPEYLRGRGYVPQGTPYTLYVLDLISAGIIENNQVIGRGQDIELPFPDTNPYPLINMGDVACEMDVYFAIIGDDPSTWAAARGLQWGTVQQTVTLPWYYPGGS